MVDWLNCLPLEYKLKQKQMKEEEQMCGNCKHEWLEQGDVPCSTCTLSESNINQSNNWEAVEVKKKELTICEIIAEMNELKNRLTKLENNES